MAGTRGRSDTTGRAWPSGPALVVLPFTTVIFAFYAKVADLGIQWMPVMALAGLAWGLGIGFIARRLERREELRGKIEDSLVALGIIASGFLLCGGVMSGLLLSAALGTPSLTYETLSALMKPTLPYFILANAPMEMAIVPAAVFLSWRTGKRRFPVVAAAVLYGAMRVWTYLVFAEHRTELITKDRLTPQDVAWYQDTLSVDHRIYLNLLMLLCFIVAAFIPASSWAKKLRGDETRPMLYPDRSA